MEATTPKQKKRGPKTITKKQKEWANKYLETGNKTQAALAVYDTESYGTAAVIGVENINKPNVRQYLEENASAVAANMLKLALNAEKESDQISAGKDVLDRAGFKPIEKSIVAKVEIPKEAIEAAQKFDEYYTRQD